MTMSEVEAAVQAVREAEAQTPVELAPGKRYAFVLPGAPGGAALLTWVDTFDLSADNPIRPRGSVRVHSAAGFVEAVSRRVDVKKGGWNVYADSELLQLVALLNDDTITAPGWQDYRVDLSLRPTPEWSHWKNHQGLRPQEDFAEVIEHGLDEIVEPPAAAMLEIAQRFEAQVNARFKTAIRLKDGQRQLTYEEEVDATAGAVVIPDEFLLSVAPFIGSEPKTVAARLRFRMSSGKLSIGYELVRPHEVERQAFEGIVAEVSSALSHTPIAGVAPAAGDRR